MKRIASVVSAALLVTACQQATPLTPSSPSPPALQQGAVEQTTDRRPQIKSPVLAQVKLQPEARIQLQGSRLSLRLSLPALADFRTQALDLGDATTLVASVSDSRGKTYTPDGAVSGEVPYPSNGEINLSFSDVVPDELIFVSLQVRSSGADIPQADLATVVSQFSPDDINTVMTFQTTPVAKTLQALVDSDPARARSLDLTALETKVAEITGVSGSAPNITYTTHPTLVDTATLAADLADSEPAALSAADYRLIGATVNVSVNGLVGTDQIQVQITDAASEITTGIDGTGTQITGATPGSGLRVKVGEESGNATQYSFSVNPVTPLTLTNAQTTNVSITATPAEVTLDTLTPTSGPIGTVLVIDGSGFSTLAANNTVYFGTTPVTPSAASADQLTVTVPANLSGTQSVTVAVGAQTSNALNFGVTPTIADVTRSDISVDAARIGDSLVITGTGFSSTEEDNTVFFGSTEATVTDATATSLTVTVPANLVGTQNLSVEVDNQSSADYGFNIVPNLTGLSAANGVPGGSLTLTGTGFSTTEEDNTVYFGSTAATVTNATATSLTVNIPNVAGSQPVSVEVAGETSNTQPFASTPGITSLQISSVSVTRASAGDSLVITGSGFSSTLLSNTVSFGATQGLVTNATSTSLTVTVPEAPAGSANVTVTVGTQTSAPVTFSLEPSLTSLSTAAGEQDDKAILLRGQTLTITGTNFDPTPGNNLVSFSHPSITTASVAASTATATQLTVVIPDGVNVPGDVTVAVTTHGQASANSLTGILPSVTLNLDGSFY
ncbi:MAG: beta strand repeat-containing protein [Candidatus Sericytochromatia bacterium]